MRVQLLLQRSSYRMRKKRIRMAKSSWKSFGWRRKTPKHT
ncbi:hypothetical protein EVA_14792 [gut metagenome]|uniref:Uncharacterized protein n=1 Tax=gut metagenome TaxID=749906 RepID=J9FQ93_9ZZZZ